MSARTKKAKLPMRKSMGEKLFLCRIVEGQNQNAVLKFPSEFAASFGSMGLNNIGLHLPMTNSWLARYVSSSETVEVFDLEFEIDINNGHLEGKKYTKVMSTEEAMDIGLVPPMDSVELGFKNFLWRVKMQWEDNGLWLGREWNHFARTSNLKIGDKCLLISTSEERKFEVAVLHRDQMEAVYESGSVKGKANLKWFKKLNRISVFTGEVEVPYVFAMKYGGLINKTTEIILPDGKVYSCYFAGTGKLLYVIKNLMTKYGVKENFTMFFDYLGNSKFYASVYNEAGLEIFNGLQERLSTYTMGKVIVPEACDLSAADEDEDNGMVDNSDAESGHQQDLANEDVQGIILTIRKYQHSGKEFYHGIHPHH
ncbi:hypothetical protein ACET3Z_000657 [Daucus carota]